MASSTALTSPASMPPYLSSSTDPSSTNILDANDLWTRYEQIKYLDMAKTGLIEELLIKYGDAQKTIQALGETRGKDGDLVDTVRHYQTIVQDQAKQLRHMQNLLNSEPFIMIIIDGNRSVFHSTFLASGEAGGKQAAFRLQQYILEHAIANVIECPPTTRIACRVYADLTQLAQGCIQSGIVDATEKVTAFFRGFARGAPLFDFIDVGSGQGRADVKVAETFKLHLFDFHCRQIFFACSHDGRYARLLEQYENDDGARGRVTLLEAVPFEKDLQELPFCKVKFPDMFCETKVHLELPLDLRTQAAIANTGYPTPLGDSWPSPAASALVRSTVRGPLVSQDSIAIPSNSTWASKAAKNADAPMTDIRHSPLLRRISSTFRESNGIRRNRDGQRLDPELPYDKEEVIRIKKLKPCNQHYIGTGCCHFKADTYCPHNHGYSFSETEMIVLRVIARETPCKRSHNCDEPRCFYGHHCPFPIATEGSLRGSKKCINGQNCRFPGSMHGMDLQPARKAS